MKISQFVSLRPHHLVFFTCVIDLTMS